MNIIFEKLEVQNFKSIGECITLTYTDFKGLNFIIGTNLDQPGSKNGSGKSALTVDALVFALFGKTLKNTNNIYIANRSCSKKLDTFSKVTFVVDGIRYRSESYIKNNTTVKMCLYKENSNEEDGWEDLTQCSVIKTRQYIQDTILNCTFDVFKTAIIIAASDCMNFYEGMNKNQKRSYIENIFNLNCFGDMFSLVKSDLNDTKKETTFTNTEIINITNYLKDLNTKSNDFNQHLDTASNELKNKIVLQAEEYKKMLEKYEISSKDLEKFNLIDSQLQISQGTLKEFNDKKHKVEQEMFKAKCKIDSISASIGEIDDIKTVLCDDCSKKINQKFDYTKKQKSILALNKFISDKQIEKQDLIEKITNVNTEISNLEKQYEEKNSLTYSLKLLNSDIKYKKNELVNLKQEYEKMQLKTTNNPFTELIIDTNKKLNDEKEKANNLLKNAQHMEVLKDIFSENGVKRHIIKNIVSLLNSLIQKYLSEIGAEFLVCFDETFDFKFITLNGECEYSNFSAGEKQRIQIATMLAFRDLILNGKINSNILIIDEMLDQAIDSIAIKKITNILQRKSAELNQTTFVISHRSEITEDNIFNNIIEVVKENGISTINII